MRNICTIPGQFKEWSLDIGQQRVVTILPNYSRVPAAQHGELILNLEESDNISSFIDAKELSLAMSAKLNDWMRDVGDKAHQGFLGRDAPL